MCIKRMCIFRSSCSSPWLSGKAYTCQCRRHKSIPGLGGSPRGENATTLYSCLGNPIYRGDWWATVMGLQELDTTE